ncbi:actin-related protein 8 isoform X2 [Leucoraja erinacea]|uniref:actin-related protein 8 isoform X2 n=1 Tax=Leucoraja erinaceus TaxID=7782 RepID=UPI002458A011|nr:actin-related protein 8 isoform X2 [Leucoraja erinacea]
MTQVEAENGKEREKEQRGVKRPIVPAAIPESVLEPIQSNFIVVIHAGSSTLRIGRAADTLPVGIPHVIARRHKKQGQPRYEDPWLHRDGLSKPESNEQRLNGLKMVDQAIWSKKMSNGARRIPAPPDQVRAYNKQMRPAVLDANSGVKWTDTSLQPEFLVGEEALYVKPTDCYNIHWPVRRGQFNLHTGPGGSLSALLADLEAIWTLAIQKYLEIPRKDLKYYRCILLIPDIYNRQHVKELVNLLLNNIGFSGVIVQQESICATFGSGLSSACVVDVGEQKTSVCCVEDGVSHRNTRLRLAYGGADVTRCYYWLMQRSGFPYRECQVFSRMDSLLLQQLKETFCHLDQDISGIQDHEFKIRHPDSPALLYQLRLGDEKLQAAKAIAERKALAKYAGFEAELGAPNCDGVEKSHELELASSQHDCVLAGNDSEDLPAALMARKTTVSQFEGKALGLDKSILHSIDCCGSDETKKKMYSSILVVGGGLMFQGAQEFLQHRILNKMPPSFRRIVENVEVITRPKDMDARLIAWKGGAVLACLDTTQELWIHQREWQRFGVRMLRERAPFVW